MRIGFLADSVYAHVSGLPCVFCGAERQQWLLARALARSGWQVVFGIQEGLKLGARKEIDGLEFVGVGRGRSIDAWRRFLVHERPDWWYWRGSYHLYGPGVEVARLAGVRTIFATAFDSDVYPRKALTVRRFWWPLYAWGLTRADRIVVQHQEQLAGLAERWRSKAKIIYSIAGPLLPMKAHRERERYVAWVGMLREPKRPDLLLEIARRSPGTRFVVCGGPGTHRSSAGYGERIEAELRAMPNIEHRGYVIPEEADEIIRGASVLLSTSDEEGFPNTMLQAWSSGTPVVSLKIDPDDVMKNGNFGIVAGDVDRAVSHIAALLESADQRDRMALLSRRHVAARHSDASVVASFEAMIRGSDCDSKAQSAAVPHVEIVEEGHLVSR